MHLIGYEIAFLFIAGFTVISALSVVILRNLFRCAIGLVFAFLGVAGIFILLNSEFLAMVQILIYVGAITVLLLFAIMLTYKIADRNIRLTNQQSLPSLILSLGVFVLIISITFPVAHLSVFRPKLEEPINFTPIISQRLLTAYVLPFEIASILLLVAIIGAIILARKEE